ncbi:hypothetical protein QP228_008080 [Pseudoglutamicibacter cumminsii]|uniref:hypothetical protein n=1 Tax=Pseudoglutamicibacter cumminsii TaxID=156979 RepID=UPI0025539983|nr:hypothetical protein [Pseudoglutamicibacter cumminsii]MDZ3745929.1 hypothetical protein [Pseudoglutamicibacter cumminsii]
MSAHRPLRAAFATLAFASISASALVAAQPAHAAEQELKVESLGSEVVQTRVYEDPVQIMRWRFTNTGTQTTKSLDVQTPEGKIFIDEEGTQMLIRCTDWMFPLTPGLTAECEAWRRITDDEIRQGKTAKHSLNVVAFGKEGPKIPVTVDSVSTNGLGEKQAVKITNGTSEVELNNRIYGAPVEIYTFTFENTGNVTTKSSPHLIGPDGNIFVDEEGQEMLGHCVDWMFPLDPGYKVTCRFFRLLTPEEIEAGRTTPFELRFQLFGKDSDLIPAPSVPAVEFEKPAEEPEPTEEPSAEPTPSEEPSDEVADEASGQGAVEVTVTNETVADGAEGATGQEAAVNAGDQGLAKTGVAGLASLAALAAVASAGGATLLGCRRKA